MAAQRTYTTDLLPEEGLPRELAEKDVYKPAGFECSRCDFRTNKSGFPGKQALRAHSKKHKREVRARRLPMARQAVVLAAMVAAGVAGWLDITLSESFQSAIPLLELPGAWAWGMFGVAIVMLLISLYMLTVEPAVGGAALAKVVSWLTVAGSLVGAAAVLGIWGIVGPAPSLILLAPVAGLLALTPILAGRAGQVRLLVKRRKVRPGSYSALVAPKDAIASVDSYLWWWQREERAKAWRRRKPRTTG